MRTKILQLFWLFLATLFIAFFVWFVSDSLAVTAVSGAFTAVLGLFLGSDIFTMIHKTRSMQAGDYKEINFHRYIIALFIFTSLLAEAFVLAERYGRKMDSLFLCFGIGVLVVIGGFISGIESNKAATDEGPKA
jgi:glucan phosphoethanolaminetransferase (alkaline phosphatase superfamily)